MMIGWSHFCTCECITAIIFVLIRNLKTIAMMWQHRNILVCPWGLSTGTNLFHDFLSQHRNSAQNLHFHKNNCEAMMITLSSLRFSILFFRVGVHVRNGNIQSRAFAISFILLHGIAPTRSYMVVLVEGTRRGGGRFIIFQLAHPFVQVDH